MIFTKSSVGKVMVLIGILMLLIILLHHQQIPVVNSQLDFEDDIEKRYDAINQTDSNDGKQLHAFGRNAAESCKKENIHNFFTDLRHSFTEMTNSSDRPINTRQFLDGCTDLNTVFERLGAAMTPVQRNIKKNIKVVDDKYRSDPEKYGLLVAIAEEEAAIGLQKRSDAVTDSILWLTRCLMLMSEMFKLLKTEDNFPKVVSLAYDSTIRQYHNIFVRGIFSMIAPAVPSKESVMRSLAITEADHGKPGYDVCLFDSMAMYNKGIVAVCKNIRELLATIDIVLMDRP